MSKRLSENFVTHHCKNTIIFSDCKKYRYLLRREWDAACGSNGDLLYIMLNPSMANDRYNDPTVDKCMQWAVAWGFNSVSVVNLFAYIETNRMLMIHNHKYHGAEITSEQAQDELSDPTMNDSAIIRACQDASQIICAWGNDGNYIGRADCVLNNILDKYDNVYYLKMNKNGQPSHPLYLPKSTQRTLWKDR